MAHVPEENVFVLFSAALIMIHECVGMVISKSLFSVVSDWRTVHMSTINYYFAKSTKVNTWPPIQTP